MQNEKLRSWRPVLTAAFVYMGIPVLFSMLSNSLVQALSVTTLVYTHWFSAAAFISWWGTLLCWWWGLAAMRSLLSADVAWPIAIRQGWRQVPSMAVYSLVFSCLILGGSLVLVAPGILAAAWYGIGLIGDPAEGGILMGLSRSKELMQAWKGQYSGQGWRGFFRRLGTMAVLFLGGLLFSAINVGHLVNSRPGMRGLDCTALFVIGLQLIVLPAFLLWCSRLRRRAASCAEVPEQPVSRRRFLKVLPAVPVLLLIMILVCYTMFTIVHGLDQPPGDYPDLRLPAVQLEYEKNAYHPLYAGTLNLTHPVKTHKRTWELLEDETWDTSMAGMILATNAAALEYFDQAGSFPAFLNPDLVEIKGSGYGSSKVMSVFKLKDLVEIACVRAFQDAHAGRSWQACLQFLEIARIGRILQQASRVSLVDYMVGDAIIGMGLRYLSRQRSRMRLTSMQKSRIAHDLATLKMEPDGFKAAIGAVLKTEFAQIEATFRKMGMSLGFGMDPGYGSPGGPGMAMFTMRYIFKPNASTALFAAFVREKIESAETLFAQPSDRSRLTLPDHGLIEGLLRENSTGKMLVVIVMVNLQKSLEVVGELLPKRAVLIADCLAW